MSSTQSKDPYKLHITMTISDPFLKGIHRTLAALQSVGVLRLQEFGRVATEFSALKMTKSLFGLCHSHPTIAEDNSDLRMPATANIRPVTVLSAR
jgi:hypothetical protein